MKDTLNYLAEERRHARRRLVVGLTLLALGALWILAGDPILRLLSGEGRWSGAHVYSPKHPSTLGEVDLREVHEVLLPTWAVANAYAEEDPAAAADALGALRRGVAGDANLTELVDQMQALVAEDPWQHADALVGLSAAWSRYLDAQGAPWRVEGGVADLGGGPFFYVKVYEVLADGELTVDGAPRRVRLMRRADALNVVESWLGHAASAEEGGLVVIDRIVAFAADHVWPLLDPGGDDALDPDVARFAPAVRAEAAAALDPDDLELLARTADERRRMVAAMRTVNERSHCSQFTVQRLSWHGFDEATRERLYATWTAARGDRCPPLTEDEARALIDGSRALSRTAGLDRAVAALAGWLARATAVHEARHVADLPDEPDDVTAEASAYLAAFSNPEVAWLSLYQACVANRDRPYTAHGQALQAIAVDCASTPEDLVVWAAAKGRALYGHQGPPALPDRFARTLPLPPES